MKAEVRSAIGRRLREARLSAAMSQDDVAGELGISRQAVSRWEGGNTTPKPVEWYRIGQIYGVSLDWIVYGIRTVPVSSYAALTPILGRRGVQPEGGAFGRPDEQTLS